MPDLGLDRPRPGPNSAGLERFLREYGMDSKRVAAGQAAGDLVQGAAGMRRLALERHPGVLEAGLALKQAEAALRRDGQWPNPSLEGKLVFDMEGRPAGEGALKFAIPLGGRIGAAREQALLALEVAHLDLNAARKRALVQVDSAFAVLSLAQARLDLFEHLRQRSAQYADLARSRREASMADSVDVALVLSDAARDRRRVARAKAGVRKARVELLRLCGLRAAAPGKLSLVPPQRQDLAEDYESLRKSALKSNDSLGKARLAFRLADRRLAVHLAEQWPDLILGPAIVGDGGGVALGLALGMEIPMLHQKGGEVEVARLRRESAAEALRQQARDLTARLDASFIELDALKEELDGLLKEAAGELDQATALAEVRYASGRLDVLRLLGVHRAFASLKLEYLELLHAQRITLIGLEAEVGRPLRLKSEEVSP